MKSVLFLAMAVACIHADEFNDNLDIELGDDYWAGDMSDDEMRAASIMIPTMLFLYLTIFLLGFYFEDDEY
jgi:hypothetical protein